MYFKRLVRLFYFACLCIAVNCVNTDVTTEASGSETSESPTASNDDTFTYAVTDDGCDNDYGNDSESVGCKKGVSVHLSDDNESVTPVSVTDITTDTTLTTIPGKVLKTKNMTVNATSTATPVPSTTDVSVTSYTPPIGFRSCECDILRDECDINCCCDRDCTYMDKQAFAYCLPLKSETGADVNGIKRCYTTHFLYRNNTKSLETVEKKSSDLFCIAVDNLSPELTFKTFPLIKSINGFNKMMRRFRKGVYNWSKQKFKPNVERGCVNTSSAVFNITGYKYGDCIWMFRDNSTTITSLSVPQASVYSPLCSDEEQPVQYLKDFSRNCLRKAPSTSYECEAEMEYLDMHHYSLMEWKLVGVSHTTNSSFSYYYDCQEEMCFSVTFSVCSDSNLKDCKTNVTLRPIFNSTNGHCMNVVSKVRYTLYHNSAQGVAHINISFLLTDFAVEKESHGDEFVRQWFEVKHEKVVVNTSKQNPTKVLMRSGTPGYKSGRPIISGKRVVKVETDVSQEILLNGDSKMWLSLPGSTAQLGGYCDKTNRPNILFSQNMKTECLLGVPLTCGAMINQTTQILLGENSLNVTNIRETNIYISKYGDPDETDLSEWVPVLSDVKVSVMKTKNKPLEKCVGAFTNIEYKIVYSYTKNIGNPQAAIIGVLLSVSVTDDSIVTKNQDSMVVRIKSSVSFIDATRPDGVVAKFADPPVYEIKLPPDFFYPFLSKSSLISPSCILTSFTLFMIFYDKNF